VTKRRNNSGRKYAPQEWLGEIVVTEKEASTHVVWFNKEDKIGELGA